MKPEHREYIKLLSGTRRMKRASKKAETLPDPVRLAAGLGIGVSGSYFVGGEGYAGQDNDSSVEEHNSPPVAQPSLWCQWVPNEEGTRIEWDGGEKFYRYGEWITYLIKHFLKPWGYKLNGEVVWQGEEDSDMGKIIINNNKIFTLQGVVVYE